jgi:hypothetical protein
MLRAKRKKTSLPPEEPVRINSPSLMERLRAVPVEFDDPYAGEAYRPKRSAPEVKAPAHK